MCSKSTPALPQRYINRISVCLIAIMSCVAGCDSGTVYPSELSPSPREAACSIPIEEITDGGIGRDIIPALSNPLFVHTSEINYLADADRVIGLLVNGQPYAIPHTVMWYHEIVNFEAEGIKLAVTYCPLTGSSMAFDRTVIEGREFGVSGLLLQNNLIMFDRTESESLWPQMSRRAGCGPRLGASLDMHPVIEMNWVGWRTLYPNSNVLSSETGYGIGYSAVNYPYGNYEAPDNDGLLFHMEIDRRRPPKSRVLGIPDSRLGGTAFLFSELDKDDAIVSVVHKLVDIGPVVVFWDKLRRSAMAYAPRLNGTRINFEVREEQIVDVETGSVWSVDGLAIEGPLAGSRLEPIKEAFVSFWFAWAAFHTETEIWER